MTIETPKIQTINDSIINQLQAQLNQTIPLLPKSFNRVLAKVLAGVFIVLFKYAGFIFLQLFVSRATYDEVTINGQKLRPLQEIGRLIGVRDLVGATKAELVINIIVKSQTGTLRSGTALVNADNGVTYVTIGQVSLNAAIVQATVRAASDETGGSGGGAIGNLEVGDTLSFVDPLGNVERDAIVANVITTAADAETVDQYRQRIVDRFQKRPQGGAPADYELWSEEVNGIINAYPYRDSTCPGVVNVYVEATPESSGSPDGIPTAAQLLAVEESIEFDLDGLASRRPLGANVNALPISRTGFDAKVTDVEVANLSVVEAQIQDAVYEYFYDAEPYIAGLTVAPRKDRLVQSALIGLVEDIVTANGGRFGTAIFDLTGGTSSINEYVLGEGEKAKLINLTISVTC